MKVVFVVAVLAIILASTTGINRKKFGRKTFGCRGDLNATSGCDKTCKRRCPGPKPAVCECPKINSCMCRLSNVYDPTINKCVKLKDCAPPTTKEDTTTEGITTEDESRKEEDTITVEPSTEEDEKTTECITTTGETTTKEVTTVKTTTEEHKTTTDCITTTDETLTEVKTTTEEHKTTTGCIDITDEPTTVCIDTTDEPTIECIDTTDEPTTECIDTTEEQTTECSDITEEQTTECSDITDEPTTECIDSKDESKTENDDDCEDYTPEPITTTVETTTDCDDYDDTTTSGNNPCQWSYNCSGNKITAQEPTTTTEFEDEATEDSTNCDDETTTECDNETTTACDDKTTIECDDETNTECDDETTTACDDKTTTECDDETTTECYDETTTESDDETTPECDDETTTECYDETTTESDDETTPECDDETTAECNHETTSISDDKTTTECDDKTTTECDDETTEAPTTTEVTTTEAIPTLDECPEALERLKKNLYALNLKFLSSYALTFPRVSFSGSVLGPTFLLMFLLKYLKDFTMLSQATGLNTISEVVCVCNKINKVAYSMSAGLAAGVAIAVKSNYTFTSNAERFMKEVIIGELLTFSSNSSLATLNEAISKLTNNKINRVIQNIDDSDQMVFLSGVSLDTMINSNKSIIKPFYEALFKSAPANYTVVKGMYYYAECPNIQAKILKINSKEGDFSFIIVLPYAYATFSVQKHIEKTTADNLWQCMQSMKLCLVHAEVPQINTNTTINTLKLLKYANISGSLTSTAEYKNMLVGQTQINLTKARQSATLQIRSAEPSHNHVQQVYNIFERQCFFIAETPYYQFITWPSLGDMPVFGSFVASFAPGRQTSASDE